MLQKENQYEYNLKLNRVISRRKSITRASIYQGYRLKGKKQLNAPTEMLRVIKYEI